MSYGWLEYVEACLRLAPRWRMIAAIRTKAVLKSRGNMPIPYVSNRSVRRVLLHDLVRMLRE